MAPCSAIFGAHVLDTMEPADISANVGALEVVMVKRPHF